MTDNDIIKALKCCLGERESCRECPAYNYGSKECVDEMLLTALDLINRQKAENERLNHIRAEISKEIDKLREVNNDLNYQVNAWNPTQTIKDFAAYLCDGRVSNDPVVIAVKCAVKEMTEGEA